MYFFNDAMHKKEGGEGVWLRVEEEVQRGGMGGVGVMWGSC